MVGWVAISVLNPEPFRGLRHAGRRVTSPRQRAFQERWCFIAVKERVHGLNQGFPESYRALKPLQYTLQFDALKARHAT